MVPSKARRMRSRLQVTNCPGLSLEPQPHPACGPPSPPRGRLGAARLWRFEYPGVATPVLRHWFATTLQTISPTNSYLSPLPQNQAASEAAGEICCCRIHNSEKFLSYLIQTENVFENYRGKSHFETYLCALSTEITCCLCQNIQN